MCTNNFYTYSPRPFGMEVKNGKIIETTEDALFEYYLKQDYDEIYSFTDFKEKMLKAGVKIRQ